MNIETQLASFLAFFSFGFLLGLGDSTVLKVHRKLCYPIFALSALIFMFVLYHINGGRIHPYFLALFVVGQAMSKIAVKYFKKSLLRLKAKHKR